MTATKAAEVLAAHGARWSGDNTTECMCGKRWVGGLQRERIATHARHQADALAAAGLLADPDTLAKAWDEGHAAADGRVARDKVIGRWAINPYRTETERG